MEAEAPAKEHRSYKKIVANQEVAVLARSCMCGRIAYEVDAAAGPIILEHLTKLLIGEDPFNIERIWDILWRSTMSYGRMGVVMNAISGVDLALWDLYGKAMGMPIYKLLGGSTKDRIPAYCTGNDVEQHLEFGYKRLKLAIPHGPADGREGMKKNVALVKRTRELVQREGIFVAWIVYHLIHVPFAFDCNYAPSELPA